MVAGIDRFREYFSGHEDQYAIIGGTACDLLFGTAGLAFRATRDIDVVLCVEVVDVAFAGAFEAFLDAGGYQARERSGGTREFYRFHRPTDPSFPYIIELFSRRPGILELPQGAVLTPIPVEDDVIRLSGILLEDSYYEALHPARQKLEGVAIIDETILIPLKARAFLDLTARSHAGHDVDGRNIRKHRNDVFRLVQLLRSDARIALPDSIRHDLQTFVDQTAADDSLDPTAFDVPFSRAEAVDLLRSAYGLT